MRTGESQPGPCFLEDRSILVMPFLNLHRNHPLPYSSALTRARSFHRLYDGLNTLALVDQNGFFVDVIDVQKWSEPYLTLPLPVPSPGRYEAHSRATLCGGHFCLILTSTGEMKIFADGVQVFRFLDGRWRITDIVAKYRLWTES